MHLRLWYQSSILRWVTTGARAKVNAVERARLYTVRVECCFVGVTTRWITAAQFDSGTYFRRCWSARYTRPSRTVVHYRLVPVDFNF